MVATRVASPVVASQQQQQQQLLHHHHPMNQATRQLQASSSASKAEVSASQALKQKLLENYDRTIFPFEQHWADLAEAEAAVADNNSSAAASSVIAVRRGVDIELGINFHRVFDVDVTTSVADLVVWMRQRWRDPRLAWNQTLYNVSTLHFWVGEGSGSGGETSEIWTPDNKIWNLDTDISQTLADAHALVSSDGTVFWSRPGHMRPVCKFQGLDRFPFDTLDCTMEIGSWSYSGLYIRPIKMDEGFSIGGSETAGEAFAEFSLVGVSAEEHVYPPFPGAPEEDWPVVFYHLTFQRAWEPYVRGFLTLQIILNIAAFCCLWLPPHIGERMSLSITSVLAAVASELVVASQLPAAGDQTWFSKFSTVSLLFTALVLFESAAVIYFYYHTGDNLKPRWYQWIERELRDFAEGNDEIGNAKGVRFSVRQDEAAPATNPDIQQGHVPVDADDSDENMKNTINDQSRFDSSVNDNRESHTAALNGTTYGPSEFDSSGRDHSEVPTTDGEKDDIPISASSVRSDARTRERIRTILGRDADDFKNVKEMENNLRWQRVASQIDDFARVFFPVSFAIFLAMAFSGIDV